MRVSPANKLPLTPVKSEKGDLVIVNLQETPFDNKAKLVIHARTDEVMALLMEELSLPVPEYRRAQDTVLGQ
jgi:NAD-dependent SIR2 family protein deacetylase